jgi:hypothetical protein
MATAIGLITDGPIITGVQNREPFHPSILTERRHRLISRAAAFLSSFVQLSLVVVGAMT